MQIDPTQSLRQLQAMQADGQPAKPNDAREAAQQFEKILVRQFVSEMTKNLFTEGLAGDDSPAWMGAYQDNQRDHLTDMLTDHLMESGAFKLEELLMRQWKQSGMVQENDSSSTPDALNMTQLPSQPEQ